VNPITEYGFVRCLDRSGFVFIWSKRARDYFVFDVFWGIGRGRREVGQGERRSSLTEIKTRSETRSGGLESITIKKRHWKKHIIGDQYRMETNIGWRPI